MAFHSLQPIQIQRFSKTTIMVKTFVDLLKTLFLQESGRSNNEIPLIYDQRLYDPFQHVFIYLSVNDLFAVASVSRKFYNYVESYCKETCKRLALENAVEKLFEEEIKQGSEFHVEFKEANYKYKWLFTTWMKTRRVHRKSITAHNVRNFRNPFYMVRRYDNQLQRHIVELTNMRWLYFTHTFYSISPGNYRAVLRMNIKAIIPGRGAPATIKLRWVGSDGFHEKRTEINSCRLGSLCDDLKILKKEEVINMNGASLTNYDACHGWFDFCLEDIYFVEYSDVTFEFKDTVDSQFKCGMRWDYVELKQTDWNTI